MTVAEVLRELCLRAAKGMTVAEMIYVTDEIAELIDGHFAERHEATTYKVTRRAARKELERGMARAGERIARSPK